MKKLCLLLLTLTVCFFTACHKDIWAELENLDQRVTKLEELCKEMNTNITSLQTIVSVLQSNDFITGIVEIKKNGEVIGYTITFGKHDPITIYHGQDGKDGADGKDGQDGQNGSANAPVIGVAQDTDGVYYWTLNGEWLLDDNGNKLPVSGKDGQNGTNGSNGQDGADGMDGQDGKNGITPQLKIEGGYWYISYDNGATWTQLGKATGEDGKDGIDGEDGKDGQNGADGKDGQDGDSMFQSVTQDENYVYFTLADGTVIKIAKGSSNDQPDGDDIIDFEDMSVLKALIDAGVDTNGDNHISYNEASAVDTLLLNGNNSIYFFREFQYFTNIQYFSFANCTSLYNLTLPNTIKNIPETNNGCFYNCTKLIKLHIPDNCLKIGAKAFKGCSSLKEVVLPSKLKRIEEYTFTDCKSIRSLNIPNSVSYIAANALNGLGVDTLILPEEYTAEQFTSIGTSNLTTIIWNSIDYPTDYYYKNNNYGSYTEYYGIGGYWYYRSSTDMMGRYDDDSGEYNKITTVIFGKNVENLPKYLCYKMSALKTIYSHNTTPPTLNSTFVECNAVENVYVPTESVEEYKTRWSQFADKIVGYDFE